MDSQINAANAVFPAQAGVFLQKEWRDDEGEKSSPRKRGCFCHCTRGKTDYRVFPAQAGVFLKIVGRRSVTRGLPRASGGVSHWLY